MITVMAIMANASSNPFKIVNIDSISSTLHSYEKNILSLVFHRALALQAKLHSHRYMPSSGFQSDSVQKIDRLTVIGIEV